MFEKAEGRAKAPDARNMYVTWLRLALGWPRMNMGSPEVPSRRMTSLWLAGCAPVLQGGDMSAEITERAIIFLNCNILNLQKVP